MKLKDTWKVLILVTVTVLFLLGGAYAARRGYVSIRQARLVKQARGYLAKSDARKAQLCLQRALRYNSRDVEAARLMAELFEHNGSPESLLWRSRVVELAPSSAVDRLALAGTALQLRDLVTASNALQGIIEGDRNTPEYHNVAGTLAANSDQIPSAEAHFREALRLQPTNHLPQLKLAVLGLQKTNAQAYVEAKQSLTQLSTNAALGCQALRELLGDALRHRETNAAVSLSTHLAQNTNSVFNDKIQHLTVLLWAKAPDLQATLLAARREAATNQIKLLQLGAWQKSSLGPAESLAWLKTLPTETQTTLPAAGLMAECWVALQDWKNLQTSLEQQKWAESDFLRHAFLARALRGLELTSTAKTEWEQAVNGAKRSYESLTMLQSRTQEWNWPSEEEQILWIVINQFPQEQLAPGRLAQLLSNAGRTEGLLTLEGTLRTRLGTNSQAVLVISALRQVAQKDWHALQTSLEQQKWPENDFLRHAFLARALRGQELMSAAKTEWEQAINGTNGRKENVAVLLGMAQQWNWSTEQEQLLCTLLDDGARDQLALARLAQLLASTGPTDGLSAATRWQDLQTSLAKGTWAEIDFLRHAFLARTLGAQQLIPAAKIEWQQAIDSAKGLQENLAMLLGMAREWRLSEEEEQLLWTFVNRFPKEQWAPASLAQLLYGAGRTADLMKLYTQVSKTNPSDLSAKNNLAMLALLLDAQQQKPHELALELYQKNPTNATYASTYAFSLYRQHKAAEALEVFKQLPPKELEIPSIAGYYGMVLQASGDRANAKKYLEIAVLDAKATFLPEERKMMELARGM